MVEKLVVHALTHPGALRPANEDTIAVGDWTAANTLKQPKRFEFTVNQATDEPLLVAVADGMGGHGGGDVASYSAVAQVQRHLPNLSSAAGMARALESANAALYDMMREGEGPPGMGTTIAALALTPGGVVVGNVGDSRIYRFDGDSLVQLSTDDTPGPKLADGRTALHTSPIITQSLGGHPDFAGIEPHVAEEPPAPGVRYLLCSDGLTDLVGPEAILARLNVRDDAESVSALFSDAMAAGGRDNISIVLVRLLESGAAGP